jgi:hypothetical protein
MRGMQMKTENSKATRAARRAQLIAECSAQRMQIGREMSVIRAPSMLTGGGMLQSLTGGNLKGPLAIAGVLMGLLAAKPGRFMPLVATAVSVFKLAKSGFAMLRRRAA